MCENFSTVMAILQENRVETAVVLKEFDEELSGMMVERIGVMNLVQVGFVLGAGL